MEDKEINKLQYINCNDEDLEIVNKTIIELKRLQQQNKELQDRLDKVTQIKEKYKTYTNNIHSNMSTINNITEQNLLKYDKDICRVWTKFSCYQDFINDLSIIEGSDNK